MRWATRRYTPAGTEPITYRPSFPVTAVSESSTIRIRTRSTGTRVAASSPDPGLPG